MNLAIPITRAVLGTALWSAWLLSAACATTLPPSPTIAPPPAAITPTSGGELPAGAGRTILQTHCTWCHDLREVTKFRGFYDRAQWRDIVVTMVEYGAAVKQDDVEVLADYLKENLGKVEQCSTFPLCEARP